MSTDIIPRRSESEVRIGRRHGIMPVTRRVTNILCRRANAFLSDVPGYRREI